jgi:flagellar motor switch protein FliN/FliY
VPQDPDTESSFADLDEELGEDSEHLWSEPQQSEGKLEELIASRDIPMQLVVEVDRIRMTLNQLLELRPGNVLDLQVKPEQGVYVTVGGKRIARGELIKLGDVLGLKILKIGE